MTKVKVPEKKTATKKASPKQGKPTKKKQFYYYFGKILY